MTHTLRITLEIDLTDLSDEERAQAAIDCQCEPDELGDSGDVCPVELGDMIADHLEYSNEELWAGSGLYAQIKSARCVHASEAEAA